MSTTRDAGEHHLVDEPSIAHALHVTLLVSLGSALAIWAFTLFLGWTLVPGLSLGAAASILAALLLNRCGWRRQSILLALAGIAYAVMHAAATNSGIESIGLAIIPVLIVVASLLLNQRVLVIFSVAAILATVAMLAVRQYVLRVAEFSSNELGDFFIFAVTCTSAAVVGRLLSARIEEGFRQVRASEHRYRRIFENIQDVYYEMRTDGVLLEISPAAAALFGVPREEMIGRSMAQFCANRSEFDGLLATVLEHGRVSNHELTIRDSRAALVHVLVNASLQKGNETDEHRMIGSIRDITERRRAEGALRESEACLRLALKATGAGTFDFYPQSGKLICSEITKGHFGVSAQTEVDQEMLLRAIHPDDRDRVRQLGSPAALIVGDGQLATEYRTIGVEDGKERWIAVRGRMLFDAENRPTRLIGTTLDITARKRAEMELRESEERFRSLSAAALEGVMVHSGGVILDANPQFVRLFGYESADELIGRNGLEFMVTRESAACLPQRIQKHDAGPLEVTCVRKDGSTFSAETDSRPLQYRGRSAMIVSCRDISERKRAEAEREKFRAQLTQAQKMESIGRLAGGVAHDFNNLLTVINGYSDLTLAKMQPGDPLRVGIEQILGAGQHAAELTRQLLAFSRKQVLQPRGLDLNHVAGSLQPMLQRLVGEHIEVRLALSTESPAVQADPHQLEQVIMNLAVNSRDAMPNGGLLVIGTSVVELDDGFAESHPDSRPGRYAMLSVSDTGVGMDEATRQRIFEPFFTTKPVGEGTGLGLSMVQGIVAQSGGCIDVNSEPGRGTAFKIYLPALADAGSEKDKPAAAAPLGGKETILIVEDQEEVRLYAVAVLKEYGYRTIPAADAGEALGICQRESAGIDLLLTDVVMPHTSGGELAVRIGQLRPGIKTLFMSGYTDTVIVQHGVLDEAAHFIQKPFTPEELGRKVRAVLGPPERLDGIAAEV